MRLARYAVSTNAVTHVVDRPSYRQIDHQVRPSSSVSGSHLTSGCWASLHVVGVPFKTHRLIVQSMCPRTSNVRRLDKLRVDMESPELHLLKESG